MRVSLGRSTSHLTYCTNIHAGEEWEDVADSLRHNLPAIRAAVCPNQPLGIGLRISASMAKALNRDGQLPSLLELLGDDYYVFTVNGFPYGTFHGQPVKDGAYRPDWTDPERLRYTNEIADILWQLVPEGMSGTISTVPCSFKPWHTARESSEQAATTSARHIAQHAAHLWTLERERGVHLQLAIEPEPFCLLETIAETVQFFTQSLFDGEGLASFRQTTGISASESVDALKRYVGVCYDVCHAAVEFEDPKASLDALADAGISISKLQLSSALRLKSVDEERASALRAFDEPVYLHQTMEKADQGMRAYQDLSQALSNVDEATGSEWRSHFHVPIFLDRLEHFDTTQEFLTTVLNIHARTPVTSQLEVETYTWDVLPQQYRNVSVAEAIARELNWVLSTLGSTPA